MKRGNFNIYNNNRTNYFLVKKSIEDFQDILRNDLKNLKLKKKKRKIKRKTNE